MRFISIGAFPATILSLLISIAPSFGAPVKDKGDPGSNDFPENIAPDALFVAHLRIGDIWNGILTKDVLFKILAIKGGPEALLDLEKDFRSEAGFWPGDFDSATFYVPVTPDLENRPSFVLILTSPKPIDKGQFLKKYQTGDSTRKGFIGVQITGDDMLLHFPDPRTAVIVDDRLADRYLAGYAKDRTGWPMNKNLLKAIEKNTLVAALHMSKVPAEILRDLSKEAPALMAAKQYVLAGNWKDNALRLELRGSFPDESTTRKAREEALKGIGELSDLIGLSIDDKRIQEDFGSAIVLVKELQRTVKELKMEIFGPDLVAKTVYKVDLPIEKIAIELAEKQRLRADRKPSQENLKQLGLAIHNYASASPGGDSLIVSGTDAKGAPIKKLDAKPLLSWRVALLPYMEQEDLYKQFKLNEPWDSEHNKKLIPKMPKIFAPVNNVKAPEGHTFYQMVLGPKAMRPGFTIANIPDGTSNTIAVVEAAESVIWTKPDDIFIPGDMPKDLMKKFGGLCKGGFNVLLFDGSVRWVDSKVVSERTLWNAIGPDEGEPLGPDWD